MALLETTFVLGLAALAGLRWLYRRADPPSRGAGAAPLHRVSEPDVPPVASPPETHAVAPVTPAASPVTPRPSLAALPALRTPVVVSARSDAPTPADEADTLAFKEDWQAFERWASEKRIRHLYHFTDHANVASIVASGGLYSWASCDRLDIDIPRPGGGELSRELDAQARLEDYVRLSFTKDHPMKHVAVKEGRIASPVTLCIDLRALWLAGVLYSPVNAASSGARVGGTLAHLARVKVSLCRPGVSYHDLDREEKRYYQAEVLVPRHLPLALITNIDGLAGRMRHAR